MSKRQRKSKVKGKDFNFQRAAAITFLLDQPKTTTTVNALRSYTCQGGLVNDQIRRRAWPILLGLDEELQGFDQLEYTTLACQLHRDSSVVEVDVQRSLWSYTEGWSDTKRGNCRARLKDLLNAAITYHKGQAFYYQGLHDIASVLLLEIRAQPAFIILRHLMTNHLRDSTRPNLEPVMELLELLMPLVEQADTELHFHIISSGAPPYFALSWLITWFAHNIPSLNQISQLFDLFMASHPLMPLYVAVSAMKASRTILLKCDLDAAEMHRALHNLSITAFASVDELSIEATALFKRCPPATIIHAQRLCMSKSCAAEARQTKGYWHVPELPQPRKFGRARISSYQAVRIAAAAAATAVLVAILASRAMSDRSFGAGSGFLAHMPPLL